MSDMSTYLKNALVNHTVRNSAYTSPTTVYVALFTSATDDDGGGTEVSAGGYSRKVATFHEPSNGSTDNPSDIVFGPATADWGTITHAALYDAATGGNMLLHDALAASKTVGSGDKFEFTTGELNVIFA